MSRVVLARRLTVALFLFLFMFAAPASAAPVKVIATGLGDPRGIDADDGDHGDRLLVADTASGAITEILTKKSGDPVVRPFAENVFASDVVGYGFNTAFATVGSPPEEGAEPAAGLARIPRGGPSTLFADILAYQATAIPTRSTRKTRPTRPIRSASHRCDTVSWSPTPPATTSWRSRRTETSRRSCASRRDRCRTRRAIPIRKRRPPERPSTRRPCPPRSRSARTVPGTCRSCAASPSPPGRRGSGGSSRARKT